MRPTRWRSWAVLALVFLFCGAAWADPPGRVGRLADLAGTVWIYDAEQSDWVVAERNRPVTTGDRLSTDRDGRVEVRIGSTSLRLGADTQLDVLALDDQHMQLQLLRGTAAVRLRAEDSAREFELRTADGRFLPLHAGHYRIDNDDTVSSATVWSGELRFDADDSTLVVPRGRRAEFWKEAGVTHYTWSEPENDGFTDWAQAADRREDDRAARYVSPEMTGAEDLDRYGQWDTHPEYGAIWVPMQVSAGWAPYRYGHWAWVQPWGWTWVDDAPWGFAPFHYGRWLWWRSHWCWVPGAYVARPVYAPALVGWVGGPSVSVSVTVGSPGLVGWVPLAPREVYHPWYPVDRDHWRRINPHAPDRSYRPGEPPRGMAQYVNRIVPGGVTVVSTDALRRRQPVDRAVHGVDPHLAQQWVAQHGNERRPPPPAPPSPAPHTLPDGAARHAPPTVAPSRVLPSAPGAAPPGARVPPPRVTDPRPPRAEPEPSRARVPVPPSRGNATLPPDMPPSARPPIASPSRPAAAPAGARQGPPPSAREGLPPGARSGPPPGAREGPPPSARPAPPAVREERDEHRQRPHEPRDNRDDDGRPGNGPRQQLR